MPLAALAAYVDNLLAVGHEGAELFEPKVFEDYAKNLQVDVGIVGTNYVELEVVAEESAELLWLPQDLLHVNRLLGYNLLNLMRLSEPRGFLHVGFAFARFLDCHPKGEGRERAVVRLYFDVAAQTHAY